LPYQYAATSPVLITIATPPLKLFFDGVFQKLSVIELSQSLDSVHYKGTLLKQDQGSSARRMLHRELAVIMILPSSTLLGTFGPTDAPQQHPAHLDETVLCYPGVSFALSGSFEGMKSSINGLTRC